MLESIIWILLGGFGAGQFAKQVKAPALIGMIVAGILIGPDGLNRITPDLLAQASELRKFAVMVILMRAGLGLDRDKLTQQGSVALRLGFLPAICEAIAIAITAMWLFQFNFATGLLLGCIISAESPAVIVPGMLRLKSLGWGVGKGIADAILSGSALSDVLVLSVFSLLVNYLTQGTNPALPLLLLQIGLQVGLGLVFGYLVARVLTLSIQKTTWINTLVQEVIITTGFALVLITSAERFPYFSGYLAVMAFGFYLIEMNPPLARRMRIGFNSLWTIAEIFLFVLMGASIQLSILEQTVLPGLLLLATGLIGGRTVGWALSTYKSNWTWQEKLFLLPGNSAKATVQAAIGAVPLSLNIEGGDAILAIAALSILVTAPLGAWAIPTFAPILLQRDSVDPTKVTVERQTVLMAAVDTSDLAISVLTKAAAMARRSQATVVVVHVMSEQPTATAILESHIQRILFDIPYQVFMVKGTVPTALLAAAQTHQADEIIMGKQEHRHQRRVGSVVREVLATSTIPILLV